MLDLCSAHHYLNSLLPKRLCLCKVMPLIRLPLSQKAECEARSPLETVGHIEFSEYHVEHEVGRTHASGV